MFTDNIYLDTGDWLINYFIDDERYRNRIKNKRPVIQDMKTFSGEELKVYSPEYYPSGWMKCTVPGGVHTALLENKIIQEPYHGRNIDRIAWIEEYSWWFRKEFDVPVEWNGRHALIEFKGVDYKADFYLNGKKIGSHADAFMPAVFDVSGDIRTGEKNILCVCFQPPPKASPNHHKKKVADFAKHHRCQMSWGWDWSRKLIPIGLWDSVNIISYDKALLKDIFVSTAKKKFDAYQVKCQMELKSLVSEDVSIEFKVSGHNLKVKDKVFSFKKPLKKGINNFEFSMDYDAPELWYPNGYGKQNLYKLDYELKDSEGKTVCSESKIFAFREIKMLKNLEASENSYSLIFTVNGRKIFARGGNWVPSDLIFGRADSALYKRLITLAQEAGFNMFRVWGGGIVEKDDFYSLCDEKGIMVWQEFPHACSNYPKDAKYIAQKKIESESIIKRLRNHPSIALWCGGNETDYYGENMKSPLLRMYKDMVEKLHPGIDYHFSSPDRSREGEQHHGPWNYEPHSFYNDHFRLFASEIGCNGMAEIESVRKFIPENELYPFGPSYNYHFALFDGYKSLAKPVEYFKPQNLQEYLWASQAAQADTLRYIMAHYRRIAWKSSGCFIWQYNESWPTFAWSIVDYYTRPKMAYYWLKRVCSSFFMSVKDEGWTLKDDKIISEIFISSDEESGPLTVNAKLMSLNGKIVLNKKIDIKNVPSDGETFKAGIIEKNLSKEKENIFILFLSAEQNGKLIFSDGYLYTRTDFSEIFRAEKVKLETKALRKKGGEIEVRIYNPGKKPACGIRVELDADMPNGIYYSDNYFFLEPGAEKAVTIRTDGKTGREIILSGWNCEELKKCLP